MPKSSFPCAIVASVLLFAGPGCSSRADAPTGEPAPAPHQSPIPSAHDAPPRTESETEVEVVEEPRMDERALNAAATAAEHAPRGRDVCETAVNAIIAMLEAAESESQNGERLPRPERQDFLLACRALPANAQQCLTPTYAMAHQEECDRVLTALPEDKLAAVQSAMETAPNE